MFGIKQLTKWIISVQLDSKNLRCEVSDLRKDIALLIRDVERNQKSVVNAFTMLRKPTNVPTGPVPQSYVDTDGNKWVWGLGGWCLSPAIGQETRNQNVA